MEPIVKEFEETDWVKLTSDRARRKSEASEVSVTFAGDRYTSFEEMSFAEMYNRPLRRGQKRANENGDTNCGDSVFVVLV